MDHLLKEYENLTESEKMVFKYVYQNREQVSSMKINDLAAEVSVSKTVVINMCQKLGFDGFRDFKYYIKNIPQEDTDVSLDELQYGVMDQIKKTISVADMQSLIKVAKVILEAKTVYIVARGTSKSVADYLEHLLLIIGIKCINLRDYNLNSTVIKKIRRDEAVFLISLSGETERIIDTARIAKARSATVISLTGFFTSTLGGISDHRLFCFAENSDTKENDIQSRLGMFAVVDLLVSIVKKYYKVSVFQENMY